MPAPKLIPHYTTNDYQQWEGDWELWEGIPVAMTPSSFGKHQRLVAHFSKLLIDALQTAKCNDCEVYCELDWIISDDTVVRPDLMIQCGEAIETFATTAPALIVEVLSKSTRSRDLTNKFDLYQQHRVMNYLVVDPDTQEPKMWELVQDVYQPRIPSGLIMLNSECIIDIPLQNIFQ